jgi:hypothetical protein
MPPPGLHIGILISNLIGPRLPGSGPVLLPTTEPKASPTGRARRRLRTPSFQAFLGKLADLEPDHHGEAGGDVHAVPGAPDLLATNAIGADHQALVYLAQEMSPGLLREPRPYRRCRQCRPANV